MVDKAIIFSLYYLKRLDILVKMEVYMKNIELAQDKNWESYLKFCQDNGLRPGEMKNMFRFSETTTIKEGAL